MAQGYVVLKHQVFSEIADDDILPFLDSSMGTPKYRIFDIKREIVAMDNIHTLDNFEFRIYQKKVIDNEVRPYLNEHPDYKVLYFGTATIPLALHLGYCFGSWNNVDVYLLHREKMTWDWNNDDEKKELPLNVHFVNEDFAGPIDVIYKIEATYQMHDGDLKPVVENPSKMIELGLVDFGKDKFRNQDQLKSFAYQFSLGIDSIANYLPNTDKIHLFPTVPVGLAFLMGTKINPNVTKPVIAYQYNTNKITKYEAILTLQELTQVEKSITEEDQKFIEDIKHGLKSELENNIASFANSKLVEKKKHVSSLSWIRFLLPDGNYAELERGIWKHIPDISETILKSSSLLNEAGPDVDGFFVSEDNKWQISDRFIFNIKNRLDNNKGKILRALRMFIFHESIHKYQRLTTYTVQNIGRFPRVLEEADYIADVWAMIQEFCYSKIYNSNEAKDEKSFFNEMIDIATKTMWAFDDLDSDTEEMQIRRVNRYLIWYWNFLQIEDGSCGNLEQIIEILANKPIIEIRGLDIRAQTQRTIFRLTNYKAEELELGYLDKEARIIRISNSGGLQIEEMIAGFRERDGEKIKKQLKSWHHQIRGT